MTVKQSKTFLFEDRSVRTNNHKPLWNEGNDLDDQHYLLLHHKDMYVEDIAVQLDRTVKAVKDKAFLMGCSVKSKPKSES